ncbi:MULTISPECIES: esterase-like activity of phytase family protein [unclassified Oleiphilus]|nr:MULTISPECIES: esterase-like activity of phytase family protein [unclassified Oleiphilus]
MNMFKKTALALAISSPLLLAGCSDDDKDSSSVKNFNRVATFHVCEQINTQCNDDTETVAEIVAASTDGQTLIYTDSEQEQLGFVDISTIESPAAAGTFALNGEPTSVAIKGEYALAAVNTSTDYVTVSGELAVINIASKTLVRTIALGGQPDSIAVSPDSMYALVILENERDEDLGDGAPPQLPAGELVILNLSGEPADWTSQTLDITGIADLYAADPEPEYVDINSDNIAVVTLQENNHILLVDLETATVSADFSAGTVDLENIDNTEEDAAIISLSESLNDIPREPDGVSWIDTEYFATADEGDLDGGSRGFTIFNKQGEVVYSSGNDLDHMAVRFGHYPDARSGNKGNEPENIEVASFGGTPYLFVNSERANLVFVYDVSNPEQPVYKQTLPAGVGPEGGLAIPDRNLLVVASEKDDRGDKFRAALNIYQRSSADASYPTIESTNRVDETPIPWSALSGLAASPTDENMLYSIEDSFYGQSRIFGIDVSTTPAQLNQEVTIKDSNNIFAAISRSVLADDSVDADDATRVSVFDEADLALLINDDNSVNIDPEGIAVASDGGFWVASEGSGTQGDAGRPINSLNFIFKTDANGVIEEVITLPQSVNDIQVRFGFEGITEYNGSVYVAIQRAWGDEANPRIGAYNTTSEQWSFFFYPLDTAESQNGGWVGLSDITSIGDGKFLMLERDNQGGKDAAIKRIYEFDVSALSDGDTISKTLVRDLIAEGDLSAPGGATYEKMEGLAVTADNTVYVVNDNDGVDDSNGETQLINLGNDLLN